jgi:hypothetical protein
MEDKKLNKDEMVILDAMRENPELKECFLEMIGITHDRINEINLGDDAEDAVVGAIRKTGKALLKEWVEKKKKAGEEAARQNATLRPHGKKK